MPWAGRMAGPSARIRNKTAPSLRCTFRDFGASFLSLLRKHRVGCVLARAKPVFPDNPVRASTHPTDFGPFRNRNSLAVQVGDQGAVRRGNRSKRTVPLAAYQLDSRHQFMLCSPVARISIVFARISITRAVKSPKWGVSWATGPGKRCRRRSVCWSLRWRSAAAWLPRRATATRPGRTRGRGAGRVAGRQDPVRGQCRRPAGGLGRAARRQGRPADRRARPSRPAWRSAPTGRS